MVNFPHIHPLGDSAAVIEFGDQVDLAVNNRVHALALLLTHETLAGVIELLPSYTALTAHYDPLALSYEEVARWLREKAERTTDIGGQSRRVIEVPTVYGGEFGPDLDFVAHYHHLTPEEVIHFHSEREYRVFMLGFTPGFPYLGELDERIVTPRLDIPRRRVPAGSVGIAAKQTGIYPIESPGGWRLIGYTSLKLFDPGREPPFLIDAGDTVRFVRST
jgi:inhibitor of KinA